MGLHDSVNCKCISSGLPMCPAQAQIQKNEINLFAVYNCLEEIEILMKPVCVKQVSH